MIWRRGGGGGRIEGRENFYAAAERDEWENV